MFLKIDDVNESYTNTLLLLRALNKTKFSIFLSVIWSWVDTQSIKELISVRKKIIPVFHWYNHVSSEFLSSSRDQLSSFIRGEIFFKIFNPSYKFFSPPFNNMNQNTIRYLTLFWYTGIIADYKSLRNFDFSWKKLTIFTTNIFLNKKNKDGSWFLEDRKRTLSEAEYISWRRLHIWFELHPQYLTFEQVLEVAETLIFIEKIYG